MPKFATRPALWEAAERQRLCRPFSIQAVQGRARGGCADGAEDPGWMPALLMMLVRVTPREFGPDFVSRSIGGCQLGAGRPEGLALGEDRRNQDRARMSAQGDIVEVEGVGGSSIDQRRIWRRNPRTRKIEAGVACSRRQHLLEQLRCLLDAACYHRPGAVGKPQPYDRKGLLRDCLELEIGDKRGKRPCECVRHCTPPLLA